MTPKEMLAKRANLITEARGLRTEIEADGTTEARAAELETRFDAMIAEAEGLAARARKEEQLAGLEASLDAGDPRRPNGPEGRGQPGSQPEAVTYREAFHEYLACAGDVHSMSQEARRALRHGGVDVMPEERAQTVGAASAGGHLVPDEANTEIVRAMLAWGPMFDDGFARVFKTTGGATIPLPGVDDTGKMAADSGAEGSAFADTGTKDVGFTKNTLDDYMADTEWLKVSIQLATSGMVGMEALLGDLLGERLGRKANRALTLGTGVGQAQGIVTGATASGVTVASNAAIAADELIKLYHSVNSAYRKSPKFGFMFNDNTLSAIHTLKDGQGNYLVDEAPDGAGRLKIGGVRAKYTINDDMPDIGASARSVVAGDMGKYYVRKIGGTNILVARDSKFLPGFGISGYVRFDGVVADPLAIKALVHPV
ncbi:phage major capsid protein [Leisingera sp. NJS201]|uniref:phage major capsid protein n=1 Tax=Leisingera sp. NJS201 TaxID=2508306 RepID=UPI001070DC90|nr:phage major capsid protein [Leisingera sp. NJS201]QBR35402.1 phage major capsid protein [Leisingera sp. NJS201]